jgi:rhodanese-related sulfurtransferase
MCEDISAEELKKRLSRGDSFLFIDVREEWEYEEKNIGAQCIPLHSLPHRLNELEPTTQEIIIHCKSGSRGNQARKFLMKNGFRNVHNLTGGMEAYLRG